MARTKKLNLLKTEVKDKYIQENFKRIEAYLNKVVLDGIATDVDVVATPGSGGTADFATESEKSASLVITRVAHTDLLVGDAIYPVTGGRVDLAQNNDTASKATVLGIVLSNAAENADVDILVLGVISDSSFTIFPVNSLLFLATNGEITDVRPTSPSASYLTPIGKSLGGGEILVTIGTPYVLGA